MSFIVSNNGQLRPYKLPDLSSESKKKNESSTAEKQQHKKQLNSYQQAQKTTVKKKSLYYAKDIMQKPVHSHTVTDSYYTILATMEKYNLNHIPIQNEKENLVGIISDRDMLKAKVNMNADKIMSPEVLTALESTLVQDIAKIMLHENVSCIPILSNQHKLVGVITLSNILEFVIKTSSFELSL